jgi:hypothetical protein
MISVRASRLLIQANSRFCSICAQARKYEHERKQGTTFIKREEKDAKEDTKNEKQTDSSPPKVYKSTPLRPLHPESHLNVNF